MLSGEGNEKAEEKKQQQQKNNRSNQQKSNFARAAHFFCTFFCRCFAPLKRETSRNFLVTRFMEEMSYVFLFTFFFHCRSFSPRQHFSFSHRRYKMACCSSNKKCLPCFFYLALALFLVELRWPVTLLSLFLCLPFSLFSGFVDMTINLNLILYTIEYKNIFCFPFSSLLTLQLCLLHKTREAIHFPTKIT